MSTRSKGSANRSVRHRTTASTRSLRVVVTAMIGALALVMSACVPPDDGTANIRPTAVASVDVSSGLAPLVATFSSAGSVDPDGEISTFIWDFGDGSPLVSAESPVHTFTTEGTFVVTLTVTDNLGLSGTTTVTVLVGSGGNQSPVAVIASATPSSGKAPLNVAFSSAGSTDPDGAIVSYKWDWGDGTAVGTTANPSHTFAAAGTFVVTLTVTDTFGATGTTTTTIETSPNLAPQAVASVSSPIGIAPTTLSFSSADSTDPDGIIVTRRWNFGDGSPLNTSANPSHTYATPGNYVATLQVIDDSGVSDFASINITILTVNQAPVAVPTATPPMGKAPLEVQFNSDDSTDPDGSIVGWEWDFGDGNTSTDPNPTHTYTDPGTYTVTLTVTDDRAFPEPLTDTASITVEATEFNVPPVAVASVDPETGKVPLPVQFSSEGSLDHDGTIESYDWDFGDGSTSDEANPSHVYTDAGTYTATLTVTDDDGAQTVTSVTVTRVLNVFPTAVASGTPTSGKGPLTVELSSAGSDDTDGTIVAYEWDFGDGSEPTDDPNPTHVYAPGEYTATLTVTDDSGDSDTHTVEIVSHPNVVPTAVANSDVAAGNAPLAVAFQGADSVDPDGTIVSHQWDFGDGTTSTDPNPTHTFTADGEFSVVLTVTDDEGAVDTAALTITVSPNPAPVAVLNVESFSPESTKVPVTYTFDASASADDGSIVSYDWNFGDGNTGTGVNPTHVYSTAGSFIVTVTVTDNGGLTNSSSTSVSTLPNPAPMAVASADPTYGKAPLSVAFSSAGSEDADGTIVSYEWDFGDGSAISNDPNPAHVYTPGSYLATLTVTDDDGNEASTSVAIDSLANVAPVAVANATPDGTKAPLAVAFSSAGSVDPDGSIAAYAWDFDDDGTVDSVDPDPTHTYLTDGLKTARLTVTDDEGATGTATVQVPVAPENAAPVAVPAANPTSGKRPLTVEFSSEGSSDSDSEIVAYEWNFGDGSEVTNNPNPTHTYGVGVWTATLKVTDAEGATHTAPIEISSNSPQAPVAAATATPTSGKRPLTVQFSSADSTDPDDQIVGYAWDFQDDGEVDSTVANPSHVYTQGNWTARLTVTDEEGLTSSTTVNIASNPNQAPVAVINADRTESQSPLVVHFSSSASLDPDDSIVAHQWNFDDGTSSTQANPTKTFTTPGLYDVTLTVIDQENATGSATLQVAVLTDIQHVAASGSDSNPGTADSPKASIGAALTAAVANGQSEVRVAGGSYSAFTVASGIDVIGGYDQSFAADGEDGATTVTVTGAANTPGVTATGVTVATTLRKLTIIGGDGDTATGSTGVLAQTDSQLTLDRVTVDSGTPSAAGSSAYGVRALSGSVVTVTDSTITARDGVDGTAGTSGVTGGNGTNGNNATSGSGSTNSNIGAAVTGSPATRNGGAGGNGGGGGSGGTNTQVGGSSGSSGGGGAAGGPAGTSATTAAAGGGGGGAGGAAGDAGDGGAPGTATNSPGDLFVGSAGGTGGIGDAGDGGGGGGGGGGRTGSTGNRRKGGSGGSGGLGGLGGGGGLGGSAGGGSFGVYSHNASVVVTGTQITTADGGDGGTGGTGGAGGTGGNGGNGSAPASNGSQAAGGGGGGGGAAGGTGGSGGGGGVGGPSVGVYSVGSGGQIVSTTAVTPGSGGSGGAGGEAGPGGTPGTAGAAGAGTTASNPGQPGSGGASPRPGNDGSDGTTGASSARSHANAAPTASAAFSQSNTKGRIPLEVAFSSAGSTDVDGSIVSYAWNFGDGESSTEQNPTHTYTEVGAKTVVLTVTDDEGATGTSQVVVHPTVNQVPTAVANATPLRGVRPLTVNFSSAGSVDTDGEIVSYAWDFADGGTSDEADPSHVFTDEGFYTVTLTVTDDEGGTDEAQVVVNARVENVPPVAQVGAEPTSGKEPLVVEFSSEGSADVETDGSIVSYAWDFGDGDTSTDPNPTHTYTEWGTYTATLTVTDNDDSTHTASVVITVNQNVPPVAQAAADVTAGHAPLEVDFSSAGSGDADGTYELEWDFGDGSTSDDANPTHTYTEAGEYTAKVTVTDDNGAVATSTILVDVDVANNAPVADISADPVSGKTPLTVDFDGSGSSDVDGTVASYEWDFDDGGTSTAAEPTHTFETAGTYDVTLTVTDDDGASASSAVQITVADNVAPTVTAAADPATGKAVFQQFAFSAEATDPDNDQGDLTYSWDFDDGDTATGAAVTHVFAAAGTYDVTVTAEDGDGGTHTDTVEVVVAENVAPDAVAAATPTTGKTGITTFTFSSADSTDPDGSIAGVSWDFGDGGTSSSAPTSTKVYFAAGTYDVTLTVTDDNGATDTTTVQVTVADNVAPATSPSVNTDTGTTATNFNFSANATDSDGTVTAYFWAFGDGTFATTPNPSNKKFNAPGTYNVTVTVTDNNGVQTTSAPLTITVS